MIFAKESALFTRKALTLSAATTPARASPTSKTARASAAAEGLEDRVRFFAQDASDPSLEGEYALVTIFEALHDMARLVEALADARSGPSGVEHSLDGPDYRVPPFKAMYIGTKG